jgi:hypothetical protein
VSFRLYYPLFRVGLKNIAWIETMEDCLNI